MRLALFSALFLILTAQTCQKSIKQGVAGQITWLEGNQMPGVNTEDQRKAAQPIQRTVRFYEPTTMDMAKHNGAFYSDISTKLVATTKTNEEGWYEQALEPGVYSVFIEEKDGLWANVINSQGYINTIEVLTDSVITHNIEINYKAAY